MTATMEDVDLDAMFANVVRCESTTLGVACPNEAVWSCIFVPCGHDVKFCGQCKMKAEAGYRRDLLRFLMGGVECHECETPIHWFDWRAL